MLLLDQLTQEQFVARLAANQFAERAAFYLGELNTIHPFRPGTAEHSESSFAPSDASGLQGKVGTHLKVRDGECVKILVCNRQT